MAPCKIKRNVTGTQTSDGAGVKLVRVLGHNTTADFDPFLMLDFFDSRNPDDYVRGFPWHPHRGIETITYLIKGEIDHSDSLGNSGKITDGSCQWMTAGSGIIHQEMPIASEHMLGVQLWLNLPAKDKMYPPKYHDIRPESILVSEDSKSKVKVISGEYAGIKGAVKGDYVDISFFDIEIFGGNDFSIPINPLESIFCFILEGSCIFSEDSTNSIIKGHAITFYPGDSLSLKASAEGVRLLMLSGKSLNETIAWGGPIVMNTREELEKAFEELDNGTFIK